MRIGVIGPYESVRRIEDTITKYFPYVEPVSLVYSTYKESVDLVRSHQHELDAMLFSGQTPFKYVSQVLNPIIPWEYIPREKTSLLTVLLEASSLHHYDISAISVDSYNSDTLYETYAEIGMPKTKLHIHIAEDKIFDEDYIEYLCRFHKSAYQTGDVRFCVTGLSSVQKRMADEKIPCFKINRVSDVIKSTITKLKLKHKIQISQNNKIVVMAIEMDSPDEQSIVSQDEFQIAIRKMRISEQIYLFAKKIQAAIVELSLGNYLVFTSRNILESETNKLSHFDFINSTNKNMFSTVSVGIGYGRTALEAKSGACFGKEKAKKCGGNRVFVVYEGEKVIGPINAINREEMTANDNDRIFIKIAEDCGLGKNTVYKLFSLVQQYNLETVTPKELARIYGNTPRSINRILFKLEQQGYVKLVGKKALSEFGRPSRVIKFLFNKMD